MYRKIISLLTQKDRIKIILSIVIQIALSFLDLAGVIIIGVIGALTINGVQSRNPQGRIELFLKYLSLENNSIQKQIFILGSLAGFLLISRTFISLFTARRILFFLGMRSSSITFELLNKLFARDIQFIERSNSQQLLSILTSGVSMITIGIIGSSISILSDVALLIVLSIGLILVDPTMAAISIIFFSCTGILLDIKTKKRALNIGRLQVETAINMNQKILEILNAYREVFVRNRRSHYLERISSMRQESAILQAESSYMPFTSKYIFESALVLGALLISGVQFWKYDAVHAVATLTLFLASGTRIVPAFLRIQQGMLNIRNAMGYSSQTFELIEELDSFKKIGDYKKKIEITPEKFKNEIRANNLYFKYQGDNKFKLEVEKIQILSGEFIAIAGQSGSGKSTLVDLLLGVLEPIKGSIEISGVDVRKVYDLWPGKIAYVPQSVSIFSGSIRENVALGFTCTYDENESEFVEKCLAKANLLGYVKTLKDGIDTRVGDQGIGLSGGQRQRLGIARAFYTKPEILILDEATSSLDAQTEESIADSIYELSGTVTLIVIAHRLSTIKRANRIIYMEQGEIKNIGSFMELRKKVPNFDYQAKLMGIN